MAWRAAREKVLRASSMCRSPCSSHGCKLYLNCPDKVFPYSQSYIGRKQYFRANSFRICSIRNFHATLDLSALRRNAGSPRSKDPKRSNPQRSSTKPPTTTRPVPLKQRSSLKTKPDKIIDVFEGMTVLELSKRTGASVGELLKILVNIDEKGDSEYYPVSMDVAELVAMDLGLNVRRSHSGAGTQIQPRPPVVTVMGHVDHGKTSLLDALRQTSVAAKEAGGITQHLGAFVVEMPSGASITFLDTPGHAAFSAMRARGAAITDIVVLVVAANDGVMRQTLEAISHAKAANVPIVVAINKCDLVSADPNNIRMQLASHGLILEDVGGDIQVVEVSALKKTGLDKLEEALLLQAEMMDLRARIDGPAQAYVVEARVDRGRGPLATAIVKFGTLICGKHIVVGSEYGKIRAIRDMSGKTIELARPAMPIEIEGLKGLPMAGDEVLVVDSEDRARMLSQGRKQKMERERLEKIYEERIQMINEEKTSVPGESEESPERVEFPVIVKADVQGTVQAVADALTCLNSPQVYVNVVHSGVGPITQSDIEFARACGACIVGFNIRNPTGAISLAAAQSKIKFCLHRVIYHLLEDMGKLIVEKAPGTAEIQVTGEGQVLNIFEIKGRKSQEDVKIAGCRVTDGRFTRSSTMRLLRSGEVIFEGRCMSLKREKQDADAIGKGNDCGLIIEDCSRYQVGDVIQCLERVIKKPKCVFTDTGSIRIEC